MMTVRAFRTACGYRTSAFAVVCFMAVQVLLCQQSFSTGSSDQRPTILWTSDHAKHLIGMPELRPKVNGTLSLSESQLSFMSSAGLTTIERAKIIAVSIGNERKMKGGAAGKVVRMAPAAAVQFTSFAMVGGTAIATIMQGKVDLLTIEYRDAKNGYHGAVFLLPKDEAVKAQKFFPSSEKEPEPEAPSPLCAASDIRPTTMKISTIQAMGVPLPAEYKVLLYEQLLRRLQADDGFGRVFRDGDTSTAAACPSSTLLLTVNAFSKGNAALRASTGPLGTFVGATSLKYRLSLRDQQGNAVLEKDLKSSQRGDSESLDIADKIAKALTKKLKKTDAHQPPAQLD